MKRTGPSFLLACCFLLLGLLQNAYAVPGFARQTGLECMFCHAQNQSKLNSFGREFARSAFTKSTNDGAQSLIVGEEIGLGIPMVLNASVMLKARYDKSDGMINGKGNVLQTKSGEATDSNRGIYEVFKTSTVNIAGRVADNVGSIIEFREKEGKAIFGGKVATAFEIGGGFGGLSFFTTNNYGPFTGMESYNTGLYKPLRQFENHKLTNAAQATDFASGPATGLQAYYSGHNLFVTLGAYVPVHNSDGIDIGPTMIPFMRLAYEQPIGDMTLVGGFYAMKGKAKASNTYFDTSLVGQLPQALVEVGKEAYGFDIQLEGTFKEMDTMVTFNAVLKNKTTLDDPYLMSDGVSVFGEPYDAEMNGYSLDVSLYPVPAFGVKMAYLKVADDGPHYFQPDRAYVKDKTAVTFGFDYSYRQNIKLTMEYSMVEPTNQEIENYTDLLSVATISF